MDKELKEMFKELNDNLKEMIPLMMSDIEKTIDKGFKEEAEIRIKKNKDGSSELSVTGTNCAVLIALAGLEEGILKKLDPPKGVWELIKKKVGTREVEDNE